MRLSSIPLLLALGASLAAQGLTIVDGADLGSLDVRVVPESQPNSAGTVLLTGIAIQPIEMTGRVVNQELHAERVRRMAVNGLMRLELQNGGRVFQYSRNGGAFWGYLEVPPDGMARVVLEQPGVGGVSPFGDRVAVDATGTRMFVTASATGCYVVRLDGQTFASTGTSSRFVATAARVNPMSPMTGSTHAFFTTLDDRVWRLPLTDNATPQDCTPAGAPAARRLKESMAMSGDGSTVAFILGPRDPRDSYTMYLLSTTGVARAMNYPPAKIAEANYLPEGTGDPWFVLNGDGSRLFFIDEAGHDESYLMDTTGVLPLFNITGDPVFEPTIGVHILPTFVGDQLMVAIGREGAMDWFQVSLDGGGTALNLTGTGATTTPFPQGTLDPTASTLAGTKMLVADAAGTTQTLRQIDIAANTSTVLATSLQTGPMLGSAVGTAPDILVAGATQSIYRGDTGALFGTVPAGIELTLPVKTADFGVTFVHLPGLSFGIVAMYMPDGAVYGGGIEFGVRQLVVTPSRALVVNGTTLRYLSLTRSATMALPPANVRLLLSGAGG